MALPDGIERWPTTLQAAYSTYAKWSAQARPEQLRPPGDWATWLILSGRGWGKTRTGVEDIVAKGLAHPGWRIAIVAPTAADCRDTCFEGESGVLSVVPPEMVEGGIGQGYKRSLGELILTNGTRFKSFSAEEPERLRGPQHHLAYCDELAAWMYPQATWDMLQFTLRLGERPRAIVTTTPKPIPLLKKLIADPSTIITRGSTFDNAANLPAAQLALLRAKYEGTRIGRQELHAEILGASEDAIIKPEAWRDWTSDKLPERITSRILSVDCSLDVKTVNDPSACTAWGSFRDEQHRLNVICGHAWRERLTIVEMADRVIKTAKDWRAEMVLIEAKAAGYPLQQLLRSRFDIPIRMFHPERVGDKTARANAAAFMFHGGMVWIPKRYKWAQMVVEECSEFTGEEEKKLKPDEAKQRDHHFDLLDTVTQAMIELRYWGQLRYPDEALREVAERFGPQKKRPALYGTV